MSALLEAMQLKRDETLRLRCLELAVSCGAGPHEIVELAGKFCAFLTGASDPSLRQLLRQVLDRSDVS